jgi:phosphopantothenoylcysteine synthetase/decarboxylase
MDTNSKVVVFGGGTFNHVACHLALAAPAFGQTARKLHAMYKDNGSYESHLVLTKMADFNSTLITNDDVARCVSEMLKDPQVKIVVMNAAICDFEMENPGEARLSSVINYPVTLKGISTKIIASIKEQRPDIIVAGFKTTHGATQVEQTAKAFMSMHKSGLDIVLANDVETRSNILVNKELGVQTGSRDFLLEQLMEHTIIYANMLSWGL